MVSLCMMSCYHVNIIPLCGTQCTILCHVAFVYYIIVLFNMSCYHCIYHVTTIHDIIGILHHDFLAYCIMLTLYIVSLFIMNSLMVSLFIMPCHNCMLSFHIIRLFVACFVMISSYTISCYHCG